MHDDLIKEVEKAIAGTKKWATEGWATSFGPRGTIIHNLAEANAQPDTFVYKLEAIAHWERIGIQAHEAVMWAERAVKALKAGNLNDADDCVYQGVVVEKSFNEHAPTWGDVYKKVRAARIGKAA